MEPTTFVMLLQVGIFCYLYQIVFVFLNLKDLIFISPIFPPYKLAEKRHSSCEASSTISCDVI